MPNITKRTNKAGEVVSYRIRVSRGYDAQGKKLKPYEMTWKPAPNMSEKAAEKEVQRQALLFEERCKTGLISTQKNITIEMFIPRYLEIAKESLSPTTYEFYTSIINRFILPMLGHHKISEIKPVHVQAFISQLNNVKSAAPNVQKPISANTVKRYLCVLQSIFRLAIKLGMIVENPASAQKLTMKKPVKPEIDIFTKQEAAEMLAALETEPLQFQVLIQLAIMTGARRGELVALKFSDFDRASNQVTIQRAAIKLSGEQAQIKPPKDYEIRTVSITPEMIQLVQQLQQEKQRERQMLGSQWQGDEWLFTQWNGEMMNPQTPTKQFSKFLARHGFRHRKFHSLRHTSATLLLYGGVSLKQVQGRLGHGDIETTNKYLHCLSEADEEAAGVLQSMLITQTKPEQKRKQA